MRNPYTDVCSLVWIFQFFTVSQRKCHFHWHSNTSQPLHISITLNILNTFISPCVGADSGPRDYHPGGKLQSRLRSQVAVTCAHTALSCWMLLLSLNTEDSVLRNLRRVLAQQGSEPMSAPRPDWWTIDMLSQMYTMYSLPSAQSDVQMSRSIWEQSGINC